MEAHDSAHNAREEGHAATHLLLWRYLYILRCKPPAHDQERQYRYVGLTNTWPRRLERHKAGHGSAWTRTYPPLEPNPDFYCGDSQPSSVIEFLQRGRGQDDRKYAWNTKMDGSILTEEELQGMSPDDRLGLLRYHIARKWAPDGHPNKDSQYQHVRGLGWGTSEEELAAKVDLLHFGWHFNEEHENCETLLQMDQFGVDYVRGGNAYSRPDLGGGADEEAGRRLRRGRGGCFACGGPHCSADCPELQCRPRRGPGLAQFSVGMAYFRSEQEFLQQEFPEAPRDSGYPQVNAALNQTVDPAKDQLFTRVCNALAPGGERPAGIDVELKAALVWSPESPAGAHSSRVSMAEARQALQRAGVPGAETQVATRNLSALLRDMFPPHAEHLRKHQWDIINPDHLPPVGRPEDILINAGTGQGKTLTALLRLFYHLSGDHASTAMILVPTQALLAQMAQVLARMSARTGGVRENQAVGDENSTVHLGGSIPLQSEVQVFWTVWMAESAGMGGVKEGSARMMESHCATEAFKQARVVLCTPDKANASLLNLGKRPDAQRCRWTQRIVSNLRVVFLDEVHMCGGTFGANLHTLIAVLRSVRIASNPPAAPAAPPAQAASSAPDGYVGFILASATIGRDEGDATTFAMQLLGESRRWDFGRMRGQELRYIRDGVGPSNVELVRIDEVPERLAAYCAVQPQDQTQRLTVVLFVYGELQQSDTAELLLPDVVGNERCLLFVPSKFQGQTLQRVLRHRYKHGNDWRRRVLGYDADRASIDRRITESVLNSDGCSDDGSTIVGTSAVGVGVDIDGVGLVCIMGLPLSRADAKQFIGRCGRQKGVPGIAVLGVNPLTPAGMQAFDDPAQYLSAGHTAPVLPLGIDARVLQAMMLFAEAGRTLSLWTPGGYNWREQPAGLFHAMQHAVRSGGGQSAWDRIDTQLKSKAPNWDVDWDSASKAIDALYSESYCVSSYSSRWFTETFRSLCTRRVPIVRSRPHTTSSAQVPHRRFEDLDAVASIDRARAAELVHPEAIFWSDSSLHKRSFRVVDYVMANDRPPLQNVHVPFVECLECSATHGRAVSATRCQDCFMHRESHQGTWCPICTPRQGRMVPAIECPYSTLHAHGEGQAECFQCTPLRLEDDGTVVYRKVPRPGIPRGECCPVSVEPLHPERWLGDLKMVLVEEVRDPGMQNWRTRGLLKRNTRPPGTDDERPAMIPPALQQVARQLQMGMWTRETTWDGYLRFRMQDERNLRKRQRVTVSAVEERWLAKPRLCQRVSVANESGERGVHFPFFTPVQLKVLGLSWTPDGELLHRSDTAALELCAFVFKWWTCMHMKCTTEDMEVSIGVVREGARPSLNIVDTSGSSIPYSLLEHGGLFAGFPNDADLFQGFDTRDAIMQRVSQQTTPEEARVLQKALNSSTQIDRAAGQLKWLRQRWRQAISTVTI